MKNLIYICIATFAFSCNSKEIQSIENQGEALEYCLTTGVFGVFSNYTQDWDNFIILHKGISPKGHVKFKINSKKLKDNADPIINLQVNDLPIPIKSSNNGCYRILDDEELLNFSNSESLIIENENNLVSFTNNLDISFSNISQNYNPNSDFTLNWLSSSSCDEVFIWVREEDSDLQASIGDKLGGNFYFTENDGTFTIPKEVFGNFNYDMQILIAVGKMIEKDNNAYVSVTSRYSHIISRSTD